MQVIQLNLEIGRIKFTAYVRFILYLSDIVTFEPSPPLARHSFPVSQWTTVGTQCVRGVWTPLRSLCGLCRQGDSQRFVKRETINTQFQIFQVCFNFILNVALMETVHLVSRCEIGKNLTLQISPVFRMVIDTV